MSVQPKVAEQRKTDNLHEKSAGRIAVEVKEVGPQTSVYTPSKSSSALGLAQEGKVEMITTAKNS
ncbi:MAG: hypothetical protein BRC55_11730 [Cyanobacteria bacterium SW_8_48_13]|jgi:hypothetical protein|nr:MAG: hypothetical protein BRC55_11730 [Cyanobacteria bacterium SW_8_48_13]